MSRIALNSEAITLTQSMPAEKSRTTPFSIPIEVGIVAVAIVISVIAVIVAYQMKTITLYGDAVAHLLISRRITDGIDVGFAQLGSYWLPLPHLLSLPLVQNDWLFRTGLAGSVISMVSYVVAVLYLYKTAMRMTQSNTIASIVTTMVFALNANVLYMQSTSMTELLMIATMLAATYHFMVWCQNDSLLHLFLSSVALFLSGMTRYEAWILMGTFGLLFLYVAWRKRYSYIKTEGTVIWWALPAGLSVILWMLWCWIIFGDPLDFQRGEYSNASLWVGLADAYIGNWENAALTFIHAMKHIMGWPLILMSGVGLVAYVIRERFHPRSIATLAILAQIPFFIVMLYAAQRPLLVPEVSGTGSYYNIRFALITIIPVALFIGYLVSVVPKVWIRLAANVVGSMIVITFIAHLLGEVILLKEAVVMDQNTAQEEVVWFQENYNPETNGGRILGENVGNERLFFYGRLALDDNIYEGTHVWQDAIENPLEHGVRWIIARHAPNEDNVWTHFFGSEADPEATNLIQDHYRLVYTNGLVDVYLRKG